MNAAFIHRARTLARTAVVLLTLAAGCGRISFEDNGSADSGALVDATTPVDGAATDSGMSDTGPGDGGPADSALSDTGPADAGPGDTGVADAGPPPLPTVADTGSFPFRIVTDGTAIFWAEYGDGSLHRLPFAGGPSTELIPGRPSAALYGLTVAGGVAYVCDSSTGEIRRVSTGGGPVTLITTVPCFDVAADATHLYWSTIDSAEASIRRLALPAGAPEDIGPPGSARNIELSGADVYWASYSTGQVSRVPAAGGTATDLAMVPAGGPWGVAIDSTFFYWAEHQATTGRIARVPRGGGATEVLATGLEGSHGVAVDGGDVYWAEEFAGRIMKFTPGGTPTVIATGQDRPLNLVVTSDAVYWTCRGGTVMRLDK